MLKSSDDHRQLATAEPLLPARSDADVSRMASTADDLVKVCPACGSASTAPHLSSGAHDAILPLRKCAGCDFIYSTRRSSNRERHDDEYHAARKGQRDPVLAAMHACNTLDFWSRRLGWKPGLRLLDVGCAEGCLIEVARLMEFDVYGIDVADFYVQHWRDRAIPAEVATVETLAERSELQFDVIVSRQVIEHVRNLQEFFRYGATLLKPGGVCIVETGDAGSIQARLLRRNWKYWTATEKEGAHVSFLTVRSARLLGMRNGMELIETVPMFRYYTLTSYARQFHEAYASLKTTFKYLLIRSLLRGNVSYRFRRLPEDG